MKIATIAAAVVAGFLLLRFLNREIDWQSFFNSIKRAKPAGSTA